MIETVADSQPFWVGKPFGWQKGLGWIWGWLLEIVYRKCLLNLDRKLWKPTWMSEPSRCVSMVQFASLHASIERPSAHCSLAVVFSLHVLILLTFKADLSSGWFAWFLDISKVVFALISCLSPSRCSTKEVPIFFLAFFCLFTSQLLPITTSL